MSLNLENLFFDDEYSTNKFFSSCPALESLDLGNCEFSDMNLNISCSSLSVLIQISILMAVWNSILLCSQTHSHSLSTPNLTTLNCSVYKLGDYSLENLSSLVTAYIYLKVEANDKVPENDIVLLPEKKELYVRCMMELVRKLHNMKFLMLSEYFKIMLVVS